MGNPENEFACVLFYPSNSAFDFESRVPIVYTTATYRSKIHREVTSRNLKQIFTTHSYKIQKLQAVRHCCTDISVAKSQKGAYLIEEHLQQYGLIIQTP